MPQLEDFPFQSYEKLRYGDTDRLGHVNNVAFAVFFETGRAEFIEGRPWREAATVFVIARLEIDFVAEMRWPGRVEIGTAVVKIGRSSIALRQAVFQSGILAARADSVVVHIDTISHRPKTLPDAAREDLLAFKSP